MRFVNITVMLSFLAIIAVISIPLSRWFHVNYWLVYLLALFGVLLNGWLAIWEDQQPDGLNNPEPPTT